MFHQLHQVGRAQAWHEQVQTEQVQNQQLGKGARRGTQGVWPMKPIPAEQMYHMCLAMLQQEGGNRPT